MANSRSWRYLGGLALVWAGALLLLGGALTVWPGLHTYVASRLYPLPQSQPALLPPVVTATAATQGGRIGVANVETTASGCSFRSRIARSIALSGSESRRRTQTPSDTW